MKVAIMQPYFFPYVGYFQLIGAVDLFVVYDNIKYTKKGWINRNRILQEGQDVLFSVPLRRDSDALHVRERALADDYASSRLLNQLRGVYRNAPYFSTVLPLLERVLCQEERNLFGFLHHGLTCVCKHLGLATPIKVSSEIPVDHALKAQAKVIAIAKAVGAESYINSIGGIELYAREDFASAGIELKFLRPKPFSYRQFDHPFVPWLSIIDVLMFNSIEVVRECVLTNYELI